MLVNRNNSIEPAKHSARIARSIPFQLGTLRQHIIVTAPAGFGKTTLLREFREQAALAGAEVAWVTVLSEHEDTATFIASIIEALQALPCGLELSFHKDAIPGHATGLRQLCREVCARLGRSERDITLFIDDYHSVRSNEAIGVFMEELTHCAPLNFQIVLASRSLPNFSTIRLRLDERLRLLSSRELQFRYEEAEQFYRSHGFALSPAQLAKIVAGTEGWAAGLQMIALALQRSPRADEVIDSLSGALHEITEYLTRYVIDGLDSQLVGFMTETSVLDRLSPQLCAAVTQNPAAGELLQRMQDTGLFLRPLDETRSWFAYHELFRDFLKTRLSHRDADSTATRELHRRASQWYAQNRLPDRAVAHALLAHDHDRAAELVETFAQERIDIGAMADVERWINLIPAEVANRHPRFRVFKGWALCHICKYHEAADILRDLELDLVEQAGADTVRNRELHYELAVLKAVNALAGDHVAAALESLPDDPQVQSRHIRRLTAMKANVEGACNIFLSRFDDAERALTRAYALHVGGGSLNGVVYSLCYLGYVRFLSGSLVDAEAKFEQAEQDALARGARDSFGCALPRALRGLVHDERNEVDLAESLIAKHLTPVEEGAYIGFRRDLFLRLARIFMDQGKIAAADAVLHRLLRSCDEIYIERTQLLITLEWLRYAIRSGESGEALRLLQQLPGARDPSLLDTWQSDVCAPLVARAQWAFAVGDNDEALELARPLKKLAESVRRQSNLQELLILEARAASALGQRDVAAEALRQAFKIAGKTGRTRALVEWGDSVFSLAARLRVAWNADADPGQAALELMRTGATHHGPAGAQLTTVTQRLPNSATSEGEALSARELVVLQFVAQGMRNKQVAAKLNISEHTVRWHLRNVLEKLNVTNRTGAVAAARDLGLLGP